MQPRYASAEQSCSGPHRKRRRYLHQKEEALQRVCEDSGWINAVQYDRPISMRGASPDLLSLRAEQWWSTGRRGQTLLPKAGVFIVRFG